MGVERWRREEVKRSEQRRYSSSAYRILLLTDSVYVVIC